MQATPETRSAHAANGYSRDVSFDDEQLILVDDLDEVVGYDSKVNAHHGNGLLHRAFSIFLFDTPERVLLQRRSALKPLWPGYWANSCCSHPRRGESYAVAAHRRLREELGVVAGLSWLYQFEYSASYGDIGAEHELCAVLVGQVGGIGRIRANPSEIREWGWFEVGRVDRWVRRQPEHFTPWFLLEWRRLRDDLWPEVQRCCATRDAAIESVSAAF